MEIASLFVEVLKYVLPAGLVLLAIRMMQQSRAEERKLEIEAAMKQSIGKEQANLFFHACERALLFLARLEPDQLLSRIQSAGLSARQYAKLLDQDIQEEFGHNLAQQLYIIPETWEQVVRTQVAVRGMIMESLKALPEGAKGPDLNRMIWEMWTQQEQPITLPAMLMLKRDAQRLLLGQNISTKSKE
ncbi:MAG: hypothetical protein NWR72_10985 [Bacteroidia bacterium]|nr:hypothetical protein [Bacteroidia bacterium]